MAIFSKEELEAKLTGKLDSITDEEYDRAHEFAEWQLISYCRERYENPDGSSSKVLKGIALECGAYNVLDEHFDEQPTEKMLLRFENAIAALKALRKGEITADANSVEDDMKLAKFHVPRDSTGAVIGSKFSDDEVGTW